MNIKNILIIIIFGLIVFFLICFKNNQKLEFIEIKNETMYFTNGKSYKVNLYDLRYIGQLQTKTKLPYIIVSGRTCQNCDENISIYLYSIQYGLIKDKEIPLRYSYPGKEYDYMNNNLLFESRMFYGNCLKKDNNSIVWIQKIPKEQNMFEKKIFILDIIDNNLKETILKELPISINDLEKNCKELQGIEYYSEP